MVEGFSAQFPQTGPRQVPRGWYSTFELLSSMVRFVNTPRAHGQRDVTPRRSRMSDSRGNKEGLEHNELCMKVTTTSTIKRTIYILEPGCAIVDAATYPRSRRWFMTQFKPHWTACDLAFIPITELLMRSIVN
jgi:hypothetical protein